MDEFLELFEGHGVFYAIFVTIPLLLLGLVLTVAGLALMFLFVTGDADSLIMRAHDAGGPLLGVLVALGFWGIFVIAGFLIGD